MSQLAGWGRLKPKTHAPNCSELLIRQTIRAFVLRPEIKLRGP
jgi:hypothetical protein